MASDDVAGDRLKVFIERVETLEKEKSELQAHIKETFEEAKGEGFDVKIIKQIIRLRKMKPEAREEQETLLDVYLRALGE